jgi:hypothetical protein
MRMEISLPVRDQEALAEAVVNQRNVKSKDHFLMILEMLKVQMVVIIINLMDMMVLLLILKRKT